ncbi:MAG: hypothetical protein LBQ24_06800 [Candidatus Peribacteria bacterium]|jgi:hypothetical protein|nr:hypothetical protein [Candidatus Peribacteria bacterium]
MVIHCNNVISSALKNETEIIITSELDCIIDAEINPKSNHFQVLSVLFCNILSNVQPVKFLNPSCKNLIQNKNMATQADISLNSGLI